eukprot:2637300-Pleurochrysis_carterae.AAC.1
MRHCDGVVERGARLRVGRVLALDAGVHVQEEGREEGIQDRRLRPRVVWFNDRVKANDVGELFPPFPGEL